jgi:hypothetical protein
VGQLHRGTIKYTFPNTPLPTGVGAYASGAVGHYWLGTPTAFLASPPLFPVGTKFPGYTTWNAGGGFTWKVFTLDFRYYDTNLTKAQCNFMTADQTAVFNANTGANESSWCGAAFITKLSFDLTLSNVK